MKRIICTLGAVSLLSSFSTTHVSAIEFDLVDAGMESLDNASTLSVTVDGITAQLTAFVGGSSGVSDVFNYVGGKFGINASGGRDETSVLDNGEGAESVSITFDQDIIWTRLVLSVFSAGEGASLWLPDSVSASLLADTGSGTDVYDYSADNVVLAGETVSVSWVSGNGFSFDGFSVERYVQAVDPDPQRTPDAGATLILLLGGVCALSTIRRYAK